MMWNFQVWKMNKINWEVVDRLSVLTFSCQTDETTIPQYTESITNRIASCVWLFVVACWLWSWKLVYAVIWTQFNPVGGCEYGSLGFSFISRENSTNKVMHDLCFCVDWPCIEWPCVRWPCATWLCVYCLTLKLAVVSAVWSDRLGQYHSHRHCLCRQFQGTFVNPFMSVSHY